MRNITNNVERSVIASGDIRAAADTYRNGWSKTEGTYAAAGGVPAVSATSYAAYTVTSGTIVHLTGVHFQQDVGGAGTRVISIYDGTVAAGTKVWQAPTLAADATEYTYPTDLIFSTSITFGFNAAIDTDLSYDLKGKVIYTNDYL